jgi:predicted TIM-barrel fold metal-dependent hydrolase
MRKLQIIFIIDIEPICQNKWNIYFNKNLPWRKIWTNLRINQATRKANQLSWKIIHDTEAKLQKNGRSMNGLCHFCDTRVETLKNKYFTTAVIQQNWVKIISALKNYMKSRDIKNIDINEITEEHLFLGIYDTILMY